MDAVGIQALIEDEGNSPTSSAFSTPVRGVRGEGIGAPPAKRTCLRHYDQASQQFFNSMGASGGEKAPLGKFYDCMLKGIEPYFKQGKENNPLKS